MRELVCCCPKCLTVDATGVSVDSDATVRKIYDRPMHLQCKHCRQFFFVAVANMMISNCLDGPNQFHPIGPGEGQSRFTDV